MRTAQIVPLDQRRARMETDPQAEYYLDRIEALRRTVKQREEELAEKDQIIARLTDPKRKAEL